ncbi:MAG: hypothetical protein ACWA5P_00120 [bacterium]
MKQLKFYANRLPYFYFIALAIYWFSILLGTEVLSAILVLLMCIPFLWQLIKPNRELNFGLGVIFICISSYLIMGSLADLFNLPSVVIASRVIIYGSFIAILNFAMSAWIVRNSVKRTI